MTTLSLAEIEAAVREHGTPTLAAKALGVPRTTLVSRLSKARRQQAPAAPRSGKSLDDFRNLYDKATIVPARVDAALKALGDGWQYESDFARLAHVSTSDLSAFRDRYAEYIVVLNRDGRRAWAGSKRTAEKMRAMLGGV